MRPLLLLGCALFAAVTAESLAEDPMAQRARVLAQLASVRSQCQSADAWLARRRKLVATFLNGADLAPPPVKTPLHATIRARRSFAGYSVENVTFESFPGFFVTGNLYRPLDQPGAMKKRPAVLCPHGHFQDGGRMRPDQQIRCAHLARMGAVAFSYSMVGWQDSQQTTHDDPNVLTLQTWNSVRAVDFVTELPEVDATRIAATGASGGGTQAFFLAAIDERIRAAVPVAIVYPWCETGCCLCEGRGRPIMAPAASNAIELSTCIAPRALMYISVGGDETRDFPSVGFPFAKHVYGLLGKADFVENAHFPKEGHDYGPSKRQAMYAFLAKHLELRLLREDRSTIAIEPPAALQSVDEGQPLPPGTLKGGAAIAAAWKALPRVMDRAKPEGEAFFFTPPGAAAEGKVAKIERGQRTATLKIVGVDAGSGRPTPCRINVVGADGNFYAPSPNRLSQYSLSGEWPKGKAWGNRRDKAPYRYLGRFFYATDQVEVRVPAGQVRLEAWKGFEYRPTVQTIHAESGQETRVVLLLKRSVDMAAHGYFGGDPHLHFPRLTEADDQIAFDLLEAEDIGYGALLGYNEPAGPYPGAMNKMASPQRLLGAASIRVRGGIALLSGQEYRSTKFGHLNLFLRDRLVYEGESFNADDGPAYGHVASDVRKHGGYAIQAHGGYGQEIYADAALGTVDAVELLQFGVYRGIGLDGWHNMLNCGYRFPCVGASDYPACRWLGDCRTYVAASRRSDSSMERPTFQSWLEGARQGKSFVTTGPLLLFEVAQRKPGERIEAPAGGVIRLPIGWRVRCDVAAVQTVDLIVNGVVVARSQARPNADGWIRSDPKAEVQLAESAWIALHAYSKTPGGRPDAEAHTNPVYVDIGGKRAFQRRSLDAWVHSIDQQIAEHTRRQFKQKSAVLAYFQRARDTLMKIRAQGGLNSTDNPATLLAENDTVDPTTTKRALLDDVGRLDVSDSELKEFLKPVPAPKPAEILERFETIPGFRMELVAAEPLVRSPVAAAFDESGNLFVCEMRDYPYKPKEGEKPLGCIRLLRDTNGDGTMDQAQVFSDQLLWAAGVAPWKGGVFVAAPPDIWYLKDTDGDGRADQVKKVYAGFGTGNQQAMLNNLQWGMDHRIYGATAGNGGLIRNLMDPQAAPISVHGRDFRFDPASGRFEAITGTVQFGNTFDDWGNRFVCSESHPLKHVVLADEYLSRNPFMAAAATIYDCAPAPVPIFRISPVERWRQIRSGRRVLKNERAATSAGASHHVVDAGAGVTVYRGGAYPPGFYGCVVVGDGQNNLVHRRLLVANGVTFDSQRADAQTEFVRSPDIWFRPVNFLNAPDGTLYCLDMCREVLESIHIPLDVVKHLDLRSGRDFGRIYRIAPSGFRYPGPPRLGRMSSAELVAQLASPHGWIRDTAHRLLYERQDAAVVPALRAMARSSAVPQARVLALWSLEGLNSLDELTLLAGLVDRHEGVVENAVRLAEPRLRSSAALADRVVGLANDGRIRVRFQTAFALGTLGKKESAAALAALARSDGANAWMRTAILSSAPENCAALFIAMLDELRRSQPAGHDNAAGVQANSLQMLAQIANLVGARNRPGEWTTMLDALADHGQEIPASAVDAMLREFSQGLRRTGGRWHANASGRGAALMEAALQRAVQAVGNPTTSESARLAAIDMLGCAPRGGHRKALVDLLPLHTGAVNSNSDAIQVAAIRALSDDSDPAISKALLAGWRSFTPEVRRAATEAMLTREDRTVALLTAAKSQPSLAADIDANRRDLLRNHRSERIRNLAGGVLGVGSGPSRQAVVASYRACLKQKGDARRGLDVFVKNCAPCHRLGDRGTEIGPNLASSALRDETALLNDILDPNFYVPPQYTQYIVVDTAGRTLTGLLAAQSATGITLKREGDRTVAILRSDIETIVGSGKSLMPEAFEKTIAMDAMADLIAFLKANAKRTADPATERDFGTLPGLIEPAK